MSEGASGAAGQPLGGVWAVVPVKAFSRGKSRLGSVLADPLREAFARGLFAHVMGVLGACADIAGVIVVSADEDVHREARVRGAEVIMDPQQGSLADVVDHGLARARALGARAAIVCMGDLPRLSVADIEAVIAGLTAHDVVLAPDAQERGTNLCAMAPPLLFESCFGRADSFAQHLAQAHGLGLRVQVIRLEGLCFDVDAPEDLERIS